MRFLLDHDVPEDVIRVLEREAQEAQRTIAVLEVRATDSDLLEYATHHGMVMINCNRNHFLELAATKAHKGIIVLIRRTTRQSELAHLLALLRRAGETGIIGNINFA